MILTPAEWPVVTKCIASIVVGMTLVTYAIPSINNGFALVVNRTLHPSFVNFPLPFIWNVVTANFFESHPLKLILLVPLCTFAAILETAWTSPRFLVFVLFVSLTSGVFGLVFQIFHYYATGNATDFFHPTRGTAGLLVAFTVGMRHQNPLNTFAGVPKVIGNHLHSFLTILWGVLHCVISLEFNEACFTPAALWAAWFWLRYYMYYSSGTLGDRSNDWRFSVLFPRVTRPLVDFIGDVCLAIRGSKEAPGAEDSQIMNMRAPQMFVPQTAEAKSLYDARRSKALAFLDDNIAKLEKKARTTSAVIFGSASEVPELEVREFPEV